MLCMCCSVSWAMLTNPNISEWWKGDVRNSLHHLRLSFSSQYCDEITTVNIRAALNQVTHGHKDRWLGTWHHLVFDTWSIVLKLKVRTVRCEAGHQHLPQHMYKLAASISNDKTASLYNFFLNAFPSTCMRYYGDLLSVQRKWKRSNPHQSATHEEWFLRKSSRLTWRTMSLPLTQRPKHH